MLHAIKNLASNKAKPCNPWEVKTVAPPKSEWNRPDLDHCFYSGFEGLISGMRIVKSNPAVRLHWIVADYDAQIDQHTFDHVLDHCNEFYPQW